MVFLLFNTLSLLFLRDLHLWFPPAGMLFSHIPACLSSLFYSALCACITSSECPFMSTLIKSFSLLSVTLYSLIMLLFTALPLILYYEVFASLYIFSLPCRNINSLGVFYLVYFFFIPWAQKSLLHRNRQRIFVNWVNPFYVKSWRLNNDIVNKGREKREKGCFCFVKSTAILTNIVSYLTIK